MVKPIEADAEHILCTQLSICLQQFMLIQLEKKFKPELEFRIWTFISQIYSKN